VRDVEKCNGVQSLGDKPYKKTVVPTVTSGTAAITSQRHDKKAHQRYQQWHTIH